MNWLESYKSSNLLVCKIILSISFPTTVTRSFQLRTYPTTGEVSHQYMHTIRIQCSNLSKKNSCGITFYPETPTKNREINRERNYISRSFAKSNCIPSNDRHNCFIDEQQNSNIFLNPYNLWDTVAAALMSLNHSNDRHSMSNQYPQPTTHQPRTDSDPVFSYLRRMDSQRKGLRVSFAFFQRNYVPDGRVNETVAKVEELSDLWKPRATDGIPPFVMNRNCI